MVTIVYEFFVPFVCRSGVASYGGQTYTQMIQILLLVSTVIFVFIACNNLAAWLYWVLMS